MEVDSAIKLSGLEGIKVVAFQLWELGKDRNIWFFEGDLGAGKTTLIAALMEVIGVQDWVSSPTFAIINQYEGPKAEVFYHFDLYRLKDWEEAFEAGIIELMEEDRYCFIEWPDRLKGKLPDQYFLVKIDVAPDDQRIISYFKK